jgi:hypothetical protein
LLDTFIEQTSTDTEASQPSQNVPLATPVTQAKRKRGRPTKVEAAAKAAKLNATATAGTVLDANTPHNNDAGDLASFSPVVDSVETDPDQPAGHGDTISSHGHQRISEDAEGVSETKDSEQNLPNVAADHDSTRVYSTAEPRQRRQHPGSTMWTSKKYSNGQPRLRFTRPQVEGEYWSATPDQWHDKSDHYKRLFTHAGNICETEAGMVAPEPCSECKALGHVCEVYTIDARHAQFGGTCARCRVTHYAKCSHVAMSVLGK